MRRVMTARAGASAPTVLMISKPVAPPWNDSSKNLVKDLAQAGRDFSYRVLTPRGYRLAGHQVFSEPIYRDGGRHTPPLRQNLRVLARLLRPDDTQITHFFFAPNPRTALAARLSLVAQRRRTVQTVCSVPHTFEQPERMLFAERVITLSQNTLCRLADAGFPRHRLVHIPPAIDVPAPPSDQVRCVTRRHYRLPADELVVLFAGDYQFSRAAETVARAACIMRDQPVSWVFACRIKQPESRQREREVDAALRAGGARSKALLLNEVPDMQTLVAACDVCVMPAASLYAKMDLPLVLLEAMALCVPIVVADDPPLSELLSDDVGLGVRAEDPEQLASAIRALLGAPERRLELGQRCRATVERKYAIDMISRQHEALYREIIGGPRSQQSAPLSALETR